MVRNGKKLQALTTGPENISILLVTPYPDDMTRLCEILPHSECALNYCTCASEAAANIAGAPHSIVITERKLPDGSWKELLSICDAQERPPVVLVTSGSADESLWAEVLNLGGYDVLLKPYDAGEVRHVIGMAWRAWLRSFRRNLSTGLCLEPQLV